MTNSWLILVEGVGGQAISKGYGEIEVLNYFSSPVFGHYFPLLKVNIGLCLVITDGRETPEPGVPVHILHSYKEEACSLPHRSLRYPASDPIASPG